MTKQINKNEEWPTCPWVTHCTPHRAAVYCIIWTPMLKIYAKTANALKK
jgi:hypothetical protein